MDLKNKKIMYFGDSIMAYDGTKFALDAVYNTNCKQDILVGYPSIIKEQTGCENIGNLAVGGDGIGEQLKVILKTDVKEADAIVIALGINDFSRGIEIGKLPSAAESVHDNTFIGNYCTALDYIFKSNDRVKVLLCTPLHRDTLYKNGNGNTSSIDTVINSNKIVDFVQAIKQIGELYACPVADLYSQSGLNRFNMKRFTFDGVHLTNEGYRCVAPVILDALNKLF